MLWIRIDTRMKTFVTDCISTRLFNINVSMSFDTRNDNKNKQIKNHCRAIKKITLKVKKVKKKSEKIHSSKYFVPQYIKILLYRCSFRAYHKFSYENWILDSQRRKVSLTNRWQSRNAGAHSWYSQYHIR